MFSKQRNKTERKIGPYFADKMTGFKRDRQSSIQYLFQTVTHKKKYATTSNFQVTYNLK